MNRVAIYGGLGNQMFQYALAIVMDANGIPTKISVSDYLLNRHYQGFELLKAFNVPVPIRDRMKVFAIKNIRPMFLNVNTTYLKYFFKRLFTYEHHVFNEVKEFGYDEKVFEQKSSLLVGSWQCIKYFESQEKLIREVFNFNKPKDAVNQKIAYEIQCKNSIAVHVRRGDFTYPGMASRRTVIDSAYYYDKAFELIYDSIDSPVFYIFSDDIKWAKQKFKGANIVFVSNNFGASSYLDMYLMSLCKHFIIANSSFSWWAAWLSKNKAKKVIIPSPWIRNTDCSGLYPRDWRILETSLSSTDLLKYSV